MNYPYGESIAVLNGDELTEVPGVAVTQQPGGFAIYMQTDQFVESGLAADSQVTVRDEVCVVVGDPAEWREPFTGWRPDVVVQVTRTEG